MNDGNNEHKNILDITEEDLFKEAANEIKDVFPSTSIEVLCRTEKYLNIFV